MIPLALSCAAALALAGLPDDAPTAETGTQTPAPATETSPGAGPATAPGATSPARKSLLRPAPRPARMLYSGGAIPPDYELVNEYDSALLGGGMSSLIFGYTGGILFALIAGIHSLASIQRGDPLWALFPLAGPLLALGTPAYRSLVDPDLLYLRDVVCLGVAAVQWLGAVLAGIGYFFPTRVLVLKEAGTGGSGVFLPLGPGGGPGLSWAVAFGP